MGIIIVQGPGIYMQCFGGYNNFEICFQEILRKTQMLIYNHYELLRDGPSVVLMLSG